MVNTEARGTLMSEKRRGSLELVGNYFEAGWG